MPQPEFKLMQTTKLKVPTVMEVNESEELPPAFPIFTGSFLQILMFLLFLGCAFPAIMISIQMDELKDDSHPLHVFHFLVHIASYFYAAMAFFSLVWGLLDYFLIYPRYAHCLDANNARSMSCYYHRSLRELSSIALQRRKEKAQMEHLWNSNRKPFASQCSCCPPGSGYILLTLKEYEKRIYGNNDHLIYMLCDIFANIGRGGYGSPHLES